MDTVYDAALREVGDCGRFQKSFDIIYNSIFVGVWCVAYMNIYLVMPPISHSCKIPKKMDNVSDEIWKNMYIPRIINTSGKSSYSSCLKYKCPETSNETEACDKYTFDETWYKSTVISDNNWVCDRKIYAANALAYSKVSEAIGSVIFGMLGDAYGRRLSYIAALLCIILGRIISVIGSHSFIIFSLGCIIAYFPSWAVVQSVTVISLEISSPGRRNKANALRSFSCTLSLCIMPLVYWWLQDWKPFLLCTTLTLVPYMLLSWKFMESPRWLWLEGKSEECVKLLKKIASVNGNTLTNETAEEILASPISEHSVKEKSYGALALASNRNIAKNTMLLQTLWLIIPLIYNSLILRIGENGNPFLEFAWQAMAELPGNIVGAMLSDRIGRKPTSIIAFTLTGAMWILSSLTKNGTPLWILTTIGILTRMSITVAYYSVSLTNMEVYPTCVRQFGMSLSSFFSSIGAALAAYLDLWRSHINPVLPGIILASSAFIGAICAYMLPETLNVKLPETLGDTKYFGRKRKSYDHVETVELDHK